MTRQFRIGLCLVAACSIAVSRVDAQEAPADQDYFNNIVLSSAQLREVGLAIDGTGVEPFPNACGGAAAIPLTVSDQMLAHFTQKGFTLESLCLGISAMVRNDVETGRQLPLALVDGKYPLLLNVPACFAGGAPYQDCDVRFDENVYIEFDAEERDRQKAELAKLDAAVRRHIEEAGAKGKIEWAEFGNDDIPRRSIGYVFASDALTRGYGYVLRGEGPSDPGADVDLATYRTKPSFWSIWLDDILGR